MEHHPTHTHHSDTDTSFRDWETNLTPTDEGVSSSRGLQANIRTSETFFSQLGHSKWIREVVRGYRITLKDLL